MSTTHDVTRLLTQWANGNTEALDDLTPLVYRLQLTDIPARMPEWSPDSKWAVFSDLNEIYRVSLEGGIPEQLTSEGKFEVAPTWSPDGKSIEFNDFPTPPGHFPGIKVLDLASKKVSVWPGSAGTYVPSWSPDGKYMVAIANPPKRMVVYSRETKTWRTLKQFGADWGYWRWSGDSKSIGPVTPVPFHCFPRTARAAEEAFWILRLLTGKRIRSR